MGTNLSSDKSPHVSILMLCEPIFFSGLDQVVFLVLFAVLRFLQRVYESELLFITLVAMLDKYVSR